VLRSVTMVVNVPAAAGGICLALIVVGLLLLCCGA
jgi:hypothetical protein